MTNLFQTITNSTNKVALNKTAELTAICERISREIFDGISAELDSTDVEIAKLKASLEVADNDEAKDMIKEQITAAGIQADVIYKAVEDSKTSHDAMDKLIADRYNLSEVDVEFLKTESEDNLDKMIKSQQSKRSRAKAKVMTQENYNTMMVGAIAENLLRIASGKEKTAHGGTAGSKPVSYSDEQLTKYANDKELLNKEIRNIQSKKSIMKSKAGFDEQSAAYQQLLQAEGMLKVIRDGAKTQPREVVKTVVPEYVPQIVEAKNNIVEQLSAVDISTLKAADAKELLEKIAGMMTAIEVPEVTPTEEAADQAEQEVAIEQEESNNEAK